MIFWLRLLACSCYCIENPPETDPFCQGAGDIALVVGGECDAENYPESAQRLEAWLAVAYGEDQDTLVEARERCIGERLSTQDDVECELVLACLEDEGLELPAPWPGDEIREEPSVCRDR